MAEAEFVMGLKVEKTSVFFVFCTPGSSCAVQGPLLTAAVAAIERKRKTAELIAADMEFRSKPDAVRVCQ